MQRVSLQTLNDYMRFFSGGTSAYGCHQYSEEVDKKGKRSGKSWTKPGMPTEKEYSGHLEGKNGLGIIPINAQNKVNFCVIDIDDYTNRTDTYVNLIYSNNMPLLPFRSKSGGLHLYIFFRQEVTATFAIDTMEKFRSLLSLPTATEIFPKQKKLKPGDNGNWINLPYYKLGTAFKGTVKNGLEDAMGNILELEPALLEVKNKLQTKETLEEFFATLPLQDAPPCLQTIYLAGDTHHRNDYLFNLACYFKSKFGDEYEFKLMEANQLLLDPLPVSEVANTVAKGKSKEYSYKCSQEPICSLCNKAECAKREFGIAGDRVSKLNFEEFTQFLTDPPYYEWKINGKGLKFFKEADIIKQERFRELCFRELHVFPNRLKDNTWSRIVQNALDNILVTEVAPEDDVSPGAMFKELLNEFFEKRAEAKSREQILIDRVFKDKAHKQYVFKAKDLLNYLIQKGFRYFGQTEIQAKLRDMGGMPCRYYLSKEKGSTRAWTLPFKALENFVEKVSIADFSIDFSEHWENSPY